MLYEYEYFIEEIYIRLVLVPDQVGHDLDLENECYELAAESGQYISQSAVAVQPGADLPGLAPSWSVACLADPGSPQHTMSVSYTHLPLPTILLV